MPLDPPPGTPTPHLRPAVPCPHCGGEVTVRGVHGQAVGLTLDMPWQLLVDGQLGPMAATVLGAHRDLLANLLFTTADTALVAEVMPHPGVDPLEGAHAVARAVAGSWPTMLTALEVSFVAHVGLETWTAGPTLMDALAAPGGLEAATWAASCLHEAIDLG